MTISDNDLALLKRQLQQTWDRFTDFRDWCARWDNLRHRRAPVGLPPELAPFAAGVDIESAILEEELKKWQYILEMNPTKIDEVSLDPGIRATETVEDNRIWTAASYMRQNEGRKWDAWRIQGMGRYGVAVSRKLWHMVEEPDIEEEEGIQGAANYIAARADYFANQKEHCFETIKVNPVTCAWFPLDKPEIFFQDCKIPYVEASELKNQAGKSLRLRDNKIVFLGEEEPIDGTGNPPTVDKELHWVIRDMLDKKTGKWRITEYVYQNDLFTDGEMLTEYENPLGRCSFFVCPAAGEQLLETDPHLRYRPLDYELLVLVAEYNFLITLQAAIGMRSVRGGDLVLDVSGAPDGVLAWLEGLGQIEGVGAQRIFKAKLPETSSGEVGILPGQVRRLPGLMPQDLKDRIEQVREDIRQAQMNRFLSGEAYKETEEGPATSVIAQMQAAGLEPGKNLVALDNDTRENLLAEHHCIVFWDEDVPEGNEKSYVWRVTGDEPVAKNPKEAGNVVTITAETFKVPYRLIVKTKGEDAQERAMEKADAYNDHERQTITRLQLLERIGHDDPAHQMDLLEEDRLTRVYEERYLQVELMTIDTIFSTLTGLNLRAMAQAGPQRPPPGGGPQQNGHQPTVEPVGRTPNVQLPPMQPAQGGTSGYEA